MNQVVDFRCGLAAVQRQQAGYQRSMMHPGNVGSLATISQLMKYFLTIYSVVYSIYIMYTHNNSLGSTTT